MFNLISHKITFSSYVEKFPINSDENEIVSRLKTLHNVSMMKEYFAIMKLHLVDELPQ